MLHLSKGQCDSGYGPEGRHRRRRSGPGQHSDQSTKTDVYRLIVSLSQANLSSPQDQGMCRLKSEPAMPFCGRPDASRSMLLLKGLPGPQQSMLLQGTAAFLRFSFGPCHRWFSWTMTCYPCDVLQSLRTREFQEPCTWAHRPFPADAKSPDAS